MKSFYFTVCDSRLWARYGLALYLIQICIIRLLQMLTKFAGLAALASIPGTDFVICSIADECCELGMLKKKLIAIVDYLREPLLMAI